MGLVYFGEKMTERSKAAYCLIIILAAVSCRR